MESLARQRIEEKLGDRVVDAQACAGGDINDAWLLELSRGGHVFAKTNDRADKRMFPAEARGLEWLREPAALRVPQVLAVNDPEVDEPGYLVLEYLSPSEPDAGQHARLGAGLATLHRFGASQFGLDHDNFIGRLPQDNSACATWSDFYVERRIRPQVHVARDGGRMDRSEARVFDGVCERIGTLVGPEEPPSRLHGDLWGGNLHWSGGEPCLIDPAAYGGHREVDLAMMRLFGGFAPAVFDAYTEAFPLAPGAADRVDLYQLYPLLVHVNLFGGSYVRQALELARRYL